MREISTKKIEIGEHVMIDGVEYVGEEGNCDSCSIRHESGICGGLAVFCPMNGKIEKVKKESSYRPYHDTEEMIEDWKTRFKVGSWPSRSMPLIWVRSRATGLERLITSFGTYFVSSVGAKTGVRDLFDNYTYLDGSPCGKEVAE